MIDRVSVLRAGPAGSSNQVGNKGLGVGGALGSIGHENGSV